MLRALRWIFLDEDFRDYSCFDPCLRDMLPLGSLLVPMGIVVTAAVDRVHTGARDAVDRTRRKRLEGNDERRSHNDNYFDGHDNTDSDDSDDELYQYLVRDDDVGELIKEDRQGDSSATASVNFHEAQGEGHEGEGEDNDEGEEKRC